MDIIKQLIDDIVSYYNQFVSQTDLFLRIIRSVIFSWSCRFIRCKALISVSRRKAMDDNKIDEFKHSQHTAAQEQPNVTTNIRWNEKGEVHSSDNMVTD